MLRRWSPFCLCILESSTVQDRDSSKCDSKLSDNHFISFQFLEEMNYWNVTELLICCSFPPYMPLLQPVQSRQLYLREMSTYRCQGSLQNIWITLESMIVSLCLSCFSNVVIGMWRLPNACCHLELLPTVNVGFLTSSFKTAPEQNQGFQY